MCPKSTVWNLLCVSSSSHSRTERSPQPPCCPSATLLHNCHPHREALLLCDHTVTSVQHTVSHWSHCNPLATLLTFRLHDMLQLLAISPRITMRSRIVSHPCLTPHLSYPRGRVPIIRVGEYHALLQNETFINTALAPLGMAIVGPYLSVTSSGA